MHKANTDKSTTHQETCSAAARNGQNPTFSWRAPSGCLPPSTSVGVATTRHRGWSSHHEDASHGRCHEPSAQ
jgi:hypothetical protein